MLNITDRTETIEGMAGGRRIIWLAFHINGKAVREFRTIVGENGMNGMCERFDKLLQAGGNGRGTSVMRKSGYLPARWRLAQDGDGNGTGPEQFFERATCAPSVLKCRVLPPIQQSAPG